MRTTGDPFIEVEGVRVDERDIEALEAIVEFGSMHKAAGELGRSYSHLQQRITELEGTLGPLVTRTRGGKGGGGSTLTENGHDLVARFERLAAEFTGLARTKESVLSGTVREREGQLGIIETEAGPIRGLVPATGTDVQVSIRSDAVGLTTPDAAPEPTGTSVRNQFVGTIHHIEREGGIANVDVDIGAEVPIHTLLTETSLDTMDLSEGDSVVVSFKATATRAIPAPDSR